ncbi:hypothetical protein [Streptomyces canus]|uniref:hypothetical protein n=1 Tax=Streptomyces canus TaxID=58343 RepID=UPI0036EFCC9C
MSLPFLRSPSAVPPSPVYDGRPPFPHEGTAVERTGSERLSPAITALTMSFQGEVIGRFASRRRRHAFADRPGDPHSPHRYGTSVCGQLWGIAPDLPTDVMSRPCAGASRTCAPTLALSFAAGRLIGGSLVSALTALLRAGLVRTALFRHVTWSVNSLCHVIGQRPFRPRRHHRATNPWPLSPVPCSHPPAACEPERPHPLQEFP